MTLLANVPRRLLASPLPFAVSAAVLGGASGVALARGGQIGFALPFAVVLLVVILVRPGNLAIFAVVGSYGVQRLGGTSSAPGSSGGITYADALVVVAALFGLAVLARGPELRRLRAPLVGLMLYLVSLLPTLVLHNTGRGELEWAHRLFLVGGAMVVGAWLARERLVDASLRALVVVSGLLAAAGVLSYLAGGSATVLSLNKNLVGSLLGMALVVLVGAASRVQLTTRWRVAFGLALIAGLVASHSRGAMVGTALGIFLTLVVGRTFTSRRVQVLIMLVTVGLGVAVFYSVKAQLDVSKADLNNNGLGVRFNVEHETRRIWRTSPITGVGLKYFNTGKYGYYAQAPNNVIDNELAESGIVGTVGFVVLQGCVIGAAWRRRRDPLVLTGAAVVVGELMHGMVDIYWAAGVASLPFIVLGMGLAEPSVPKALGPDERPGQRSRHRAVATM